MYAVMQVNGPHKVSLFPFLTQAKMFWCHTLKLRDILTLYSTLVDF